MTPLFLRAGACAVLAAALSFPVLAQQEKAESKTPAKQSSQDRGKGGLAKQDAKFLRSMAQADLAEVEAGKLASGKASSDEVKKFAQHMVEDHGKGLSEGQSLAKAKGIEPPKAPAKKHQAAMKKLESQNGADFDKAYMSQMVKDHRDTLKLVQNASDKAKDPDIRAAAEKKIPIVEEHLRTAQQMNASLGGGKSKGDGDSPKRRSEKS